MPYGPCVVCGDTNYPSSYGGSNICPKCDCGLPPNKFTDAKAAGNIGINSKFADYGVTCQGGRLPDESPYSKEDVEELVRALDQISRYGESGICPFGCDCPDIAATALAKFRKEE